MSRRSSDLRCLLALPAAILLAGCVLAPRGAKDEKSRVTAAGRPYDAPIEKRTLPELPAQPSWRDVLHRAFLANGDLEASYFEWKAALARIDMNAAYPNTNLALGFEYMFSKEMMKSWDRTTLSAQPDPAMSLSFPTKVAKKGQIALAEARAAGHRFQSAKFTLQRQVLTTYLDLALMEEKIRIQRDNVSLLQLLSETAANRVQAGGPQQDLLKAQIEHRLAENELASMESEAHAMRAMLNGMLARDPQATLKLASVPAPRPVAADDARLIAIATDLNPELAALARRLQGQRNALELARMAYIPDINPMGAITGSVSQSLGAMVMLPTNLPMIRGQINEAQAMLRSMQAMTRQTQNDRAASFVAALYALRNAERQIAFLQDRILPAAQQVLGSSRQAYASGTVGFADLIDSQRTLLEVRRMIAEVKIAREQRLADLEALAGVDIETLAQPTTSPATRPTTQNAGAASADRLFGREGSRAVSSSPVSYRSAGTVILRYSEESGWSVGQARSFGVPQDDIVVLRQVGAASAAVSTQHSALSTQH
jgi:outer membrane protein TolC